MNKRDAYQLLAKRMCCFCGARLLAITARYANDRATEKTRYYTCESCGTYKDYEVDDYVLGTECADYSPSDADPGL